MESTVARLLEQIGELQRTKEAELAGLDRLQSELRNLRQLPQFAGKQDSAEIQDLRKRICGSLVGAAYDGSLTNALSMTEPIAGPTAEPMAGLRAEPIAEPMVTPTHLHQGSNGHHMDHNHKTAPTAYQSGALVTGSQVTSEPVVESRKTLCAKTDVDFAATGCFSATASEPLVKKYKGFREHAYRLVFPYEDKFPDLEPELLTILPSGVIENSKKLAAEKERGLITYPYAQFVEAIVAQTVVHNADSSWNTNAYSETPFVTESGGKFSLVQTWPTKFNAKFKEDFECNETNTDTSHFEPGAVQAFKTCIDTLFGEDATDKSRIQHCHKVTLNNFPCYVGLTESLKDYLKKNPAEMTEVGIKELTPEGFISTGKDGKDNPVEKPFKMESNTKHVIYKKVGWETMGCCKPLEQFLKECEFQAEEE